MADFLIINGEILSEQEARLAVLPTDTLIVSQKVWFGYGGIPLLQQNIVSIKKQLESLGAKLPDLLQNKRETFRLTKRMLNKNKFYRSGLISFQFILSRERVDYVVRAKAKEIFDFPLSEQGLLVEFYNDQVCDKNRFSKLRCHHVNHWRMAESQINTRTKTSQILLNHKHFLTEGVASNLFMVKDGVLISPDLTTGCYEDVLRHIVLELAKKMKLKIIETPNIEMQHFLSMDEAFFISEEKGIQWILGIANKRFVNEVSSQLHLQLNDYLKELV